MFVFLKKFLTNITTVWNCKQKDFLPGLMWNIQRKAKVKINYNNRYSADISGAE